MTAPFHRLLAFYSNRSDAPDTQTVRLGDSIRGNLALGLDFPVALCVALGRHLWLRNTGLLSLDIFVPAVARRATPLDGLRVDDGSSSSSSSSSDIGRGYSRREFVRLARRQLGLFAAVDALGLWALAADVRTGLLRADDVRAFQRGELLERIERRRRDREQVLPLWRGGPISVAGHSWMVGKVFGVRVYEEERRDD